MDRKNMLKVSTISLTFTLLTFIVLSTGDAGLTKLKGETVLYNFSINKNTTLNFSTPDSGHIDLRTTEFGFEKASNANNGVLAFKERGIIFNKTPINSITKFKISFDKETFGEAKLYYGNHFLSFENVVELADTNNIDVPEGNSFFVLQNYGANNILDSFSVYFTCENVYQPKELPVVNIETEINENGKHLPINSRVDYTNGTIEVIDPNNQKNNLNAKAAGIRIRGNSTANRPKKPYRIKFDKKQSMFGLTKAKSWVLLADYMDGSKMHNWLALNFARMVRGEEFVPSTNHVRLFINGEDMGLYLLSEHCDEKEGRLNLPENENLLNITTLDDLSFMVERDLSTKQDSSEILDRTYFNVTQSNGTEYTYALKYPEYEDFSYVDDSGETMIDDERFDVYRELLRDYFYNLGELFIRYEKDCEIYDDICNIINVNSLASYALTDVFMNESDHTQKSYKIYKNPGCKLCFGPTWDYDSCVCGLPYQGKIIEEPFAVRDPKSYAQLLYCGDFWGKTLVKDTQHGLKDLQNIWSSLSNDDIEEFLKAFYSEIDSISDLLLYDHSMWNSEINHQCLSIFDNLNYLSMYLEAKIQYFNKKLYK